MVPLKEVLEKRFGGDFPVGTGTSKRDDPLVITDQRDYVSIEHGVAQFLLEQMGFEYELEKQQTHNYDGRVIDELIYAAKEAGETEWTQTWRFFFDITAGFNRNSPTSPQRPNIPSVHVFGHSSYSDAPTKIGAGKIRRYTMWIHPGDADLKHLKSVEHKWEIGGFLLGPIWVLIQRGPPLLALLILALAIAPFFVFGIKFFTIIWAVIVWTLNARSHSGLQAIRLRSLGHDRLGDISAQSHEEALDLFRRSRG